MKLKEVASYAWDNALELNFGSIDMWDSETFQSNWFNQYYPDHWVNKGASGLYWFIIKDKTLKELKEIEIPSNLPLKGTNIARSDCNYE